MKRSLIALLLALTIFSSCGYEQTDVVAEIEATPRVAETVVETPTPSPSEKPEKKHPSSPTPEAAAETPTPEVSEASEPVTTCSLSVTCESLLDNLDKLKEEKRPLVPSDGIIFKTQTVEFSEGESVFDVMLREMKDSKIHFEFVKTPLYDSVYIEGIGNLYEFDCGRHSGWMYRVNGESPTYGCSHYIVKNGDKIEFYYNCDIFAK